MIDEAGPLGIYADARMLSAGIETLRELAADREKAGDSARVYDFSIRWGVLMSGRLKRLEHYYRAGELTEDQEQRYRELRRQLGDVKPLTERLGISQPTVPLED